MDGNTRTGSYRHNGTNAGANRFTGVNGPSEDTPFSLDSAFIQLGPLTAGKIQSFSFYANDYGFGSCAPRTAVDALAYTAFGGGFNLRSRSKTEDHEPSATVPASWALMRRALISVLYSNGYQGTT